MMSTLQSSTLLSKVEESIAPLAAHYEKDGKIDEQELLVNSRISIAVDSTNNDNPVISLRLSIPERLWMRIDGSESVLADRICEDLKREAGISEPKAQVLIEKDGLHGADWRKASGLLLLGQRGQITKAEEDLWGTGSPRVFLSHRADVINKVAELRKELSNFGMSCFAASESIEAGREWESSIRIALSTMDVLIALVTEDFNESVWTQQEVGYALGSEVPVYALMIGRPLLPAPAGFLSRIQASRCDWQTVAVEIGKQVVKGGRRVDAFINAMKSCRNFEDANRLSNLLPGIERLNPMQEARIVEAYNENSEVFGAFGFNGKNPGFYGEGLIPILHRATGHAYVLENDRIQRPVVAEGS